MIAPGQERHGSPNTIITDGVRSYHAAMNDLCNGEKQEIDRRANNRAENSHPPVRRNERAMLRFRQITTLRCARCHGRVYVLGSHTSRGSFRVAHRRTLLGCGQSENEAPSGCADLTAIVQR